MVAEVLGGAAVHLSPLGGETDVPAVLAIQHEGQGRAVYFAPAIGNRYLEFGVSAQRDLIGTVVRWAAGSQPPVWLEKAPMTMALTAFTQPDQDRLIVHLVNSVQQEIIQPLEEIAEYRDIRLKVKHGRTPKRIVSLLSGKELTWTIDSETISVDLPSIRISEVLLLEFS